MTRLQGAEMGERTASFGAASRKRPFSLLLLVGYLFLSAHAFQPSVLRSSRLRSLLLNQRPTKIIDLDTTTSSVTSDSTTESSLQLQTSTPFELDEQDETKKQILLLLLWLSSFLAALDRVAMSVAILPMSTEFGWTSTLKGSVASFFSLGYGICILPAGLMVASLSPRLCMMLGVATWSVATLGTPYSAALQGLAPLFAIRAVVGAGECIVIPATQRFLSLWTTTEEKSRSLAFVFSGFAFGKISAYLASPLILDAGWRQLFYTFGGAGLLLLLPWAFLAQDEPDSFQQDEYSLQTKTEVSALQQAQQTIQDAPWAAMMQSPGVWAMLLAHSAKNWGLYNALTWTPTFYSQQYGIGVKDSALLSVLPGVAGIVGAFVVGQAADRVVRHMEDPDSVEEKTRIRKGFQSLGLFGPALGLGYLASHIPEHAWVAQVLLSMSFGMQAFNLGGFEAANQEKAGPQWAGLLYSVTSLPGVLVGTGGVYITGRILDATNQDWSVVFGLNSVVNILGALSFLALYDSKREFD